MYGNWPIPDNDCVRDEALQRIGNRAKNCVLPLPRPQSRPMTWHRGLSAGTMQCERCSLEILLQSSTAHVMNHLDRAVGLV